MQFEPQNFKVYFLDNNSIFTKEIFARLKILTLPNLVAKNCLIMMHKIYLNVAPINIYSMFTVVDNNNRNRNPRREPDDFNVPYFRLKSSDKTILYKGPTLYNDFVNKLNKNFHLFHS